MSSHATTRLCAWCHQPLPASMRRDAITCSKRCRQARHRFEHSVKSAAPPAGDQLSALRIAYADPPYPGKAARYYRGHKDYAGEVDHAALIASLSAEYDGWALSTSSDALQSILEMCPPHIKVAAWIRGSRPGVTRRYPSTAWEPLIYHPARSQATLRLLTNTTAITDVLIHVARPRLTDPDRVIGAKPAAFASWMFRLVGALPGDLFVDIFPGSGGISRAWNIYTGT